MRVTALRRAFAVLVLGQLAIFVLSLPGFGIETRKPSEYAAWAGPVFLGLTILVLLLGLGALVMWRSSPSLGYRLGLGQAIAAVITNVLDISHVGGPPPPPGPLALGAISIVVAVAVVAIVWLLSESPLSETQDKA